MRIIAHRGNTSGPLSVSENAPKSIERMIEDGFDAEIDLWLLPEGTFFLGHDKPEYKIELRWLIKSNENLWIHCKNMNALEFFSHSKEKFKFFFHDKDSYTLVSNGRIWVYPGKELPKGSICVLPELNRDKNGYLSLPENLFGVCTDYPYEVVVTLNLSHPSNLNNKLG